MFITSAVQVIYPVILSAGFLLAWINIHYIFTSWFSLVPKQVMCNAYSKRLIFEA